MHPLGQFAGVTGPGTVQFEITDEKASCGIWTNQNQRMTTPTFQRGISGNLLRFRKAFARGALPTSYIKGRRQLINSEMCKLVISLPIPLLRTLSKRWIPI